MLGRNVGEPYHEPKNFRITTSHQNKIVNLLNTLRLLVIV